MSLPWKGNYTLSIQDCNSSRKLEFFVLIDTQWMNGHMKMNSHILCVWYVQHMFPWLCACMCWYRCSRKPQANGRLALGLPPLYFEVGSLTEPPSSLFCKWALGICLSLTFQHGTTEAHTVPSLNTDIGNLNSGPHDWTISLPPYS